MSNNQAASSWGNSTNVDEFRKTSNANNSGSSKQSPGKAGRPSPYKSRNERDSKWSFSKISDVHHRISTGQLLGQISIKIKLNAKRKLW